MATTAIEKKEAEDQAPERLDGGVRFTPLVDIIEAKDAYTFYIDLPGVKAGDVDMTCEDDTVTIDAKVALRQEQAQRYLVQEYRIGGFSRSFRIGTPINPDGIRAELKNGELILTVPKAESAKTRKIEIKQS